MFFMTRSLPALLASFIGIDGAYPPRKLPVYGVGFWLLMALPALIHSPAHAGWVAVEKRYQTLDLQTLYFDPETIRRENHLATLWQLADIRWMDGAPTPRFLSAKTHKQFDCARPRFRVLEIVQFSRQMATGKSWNGYIENGSWQAVESQTVDHALWQAACGKK